MHTQPLLLRSLQLLGPPSWPDVQTPLDGVNSRHAHTHPAAQGCACPSEVAALPLLQQLLLPVALHSHHIHSIKTVLLLLLLLLQVVELRTRHQSSGEHVPLSFLPELVAFHLEVLPKKEISPQACCIHLQYRRVAAECRRIYLQLF